MRLFSRSTSDETRPDRFVRSRWAAAGAAIAVAAAGLLPASASLDTGDRPVFVPITPCRLVDTRPAPEQEGPRGTPLIANETLVVQVHGANGNCLIPTDAVGVVMNVAAIFPTADSYLTVFPSDVAKPLAANLNWTASQPPVSNAVTADLSADGKVSFYNLAGSVNVAADIVGYFVDHTHDDRYYTKAQTDAAIVAGVAGAIDPAELATALAGKVSKPVGPQSVVVDPGAFHPVLSNQTFDYSAGDVYAGPAGVPGIFHAPVQLPQGAVVTGIAARVSDQDTDGADNIQIALRRNPPVGGTGFEPMALTSVTAGNPGAVTLNDADGIVTNATIDNANYSYQLMADKLTESIRLYSVTITYTLP